MGWLRHVLTVLSVLIFVSVLWSDLDVLIRCDGLINILTVILWISGDEERQQFSVNNFLNCDILNHGDQYYLPVKTRLTVIKHNF